MIRKTLRIPYNLFVAFDQVLNVLLLGEPHETVSLRAAKAREDGQRWGCVLCRILDALHKQHCARVLERRRNLR